MTQGKKPYIQMFSIHGLVRAENMELGRDADTGGQIKYVVELGRHLSRRNDIGRVDLFTRLIADKAVSEDYAAVEEKVTDKFSIIRIQCGGRKYKRKELLWPHLDEYVDRAIKRYRQNRTVPDLVHGHYPDGGYVAMHLARIFGLPFVYTGHSLGRSKLQKLLADGMAEKEIIRKYKIDRRIKVEEDILANADLVVTSTRQEVDGQYGQYENRKIPGYCVIPPGIDIQRFHPFYHDKLSESRPSEDERFAQATMLEGLNRFFLHPDKPLILSLCRPDKRKNISGLVKAFGEDLELQAMANLAVFAGIRKDIDTMEENERDVLTQMLLLMDKYDLYGKMAIPKRHESEYQVPALYRIAAQTRGVFINPAMVEPFGLTLLEAAATGLPIVATKYGGPKDIVKNCENGLLVEPADPKKMAGALKKIITDPAFWDACSKNGIMNVRKHYTWESHAGTYAKKILPTMQNGEYDMSKDTPPTGPVGRGPVGRRLLALQSFLVTDIDNTLIGEDNDRLDELVEFINENRECMGFAVATGRTVDSARSVLKEHGLPAPDVVISSVGAEIYYQGHNLQFGQGWAAHIKHRWDRDKIVSLLESMDFLEYQDEATQRPFKVSYFMDPGKDRLAAVHNRLLSAKRRYSLIYSHGRYLDILPYRASKGKAIRYLSYKWGIPLPRFLVCGDSGNDAEMLKGEPMGVVVGDFSPELFALKGASRIFFAPSACAGGILEGITHYRFTEKIKSECHGNSK